MPTPSPQTTTPVDTGLADDGLAADARAVLHELTDDPTAEFRPGQLEAIEALLVGRRRVFVVQRTGWGKSAVYFVATALLRRRGAGPTLIVSPLLSLMRNQVAAARRAGIAAHTVNSGNVAEWEDVRGRLADDAVDVLLVSPERLNSPQFRQAWLPALADTAGMLVVDEAHCISDWGHDFRPDYRRVRDLLDRLPPDTPVLATTATANARVVTDVADQLAAGGQAVHTLRGALSRDALRLGVLRLPDADRVPWLAEHLAALPGAGIVYTLTVAQAEDVAAALRQAGHDVRPYTGRLDPDERVAAEQGLLANQVKALVATSALGMGFDKPDLGFVVHLGSPASPIAYYQQVGRAGRAVDSADVLLLPGPQDEAIWAYFASLAFPGRGAVTRVLDVLAQASRPMSTPALEPLVDLRRSRLELLLKVLDVDGAVRRVSGGWEATGEPWQYDAERYDRVAAARDAEAAAMRSYARDVDPTILSPADVSPSAPPPAVCRMRFLREHLDDPWAEDCGRCDVCIGPWYPTSVSARSREVVSRVVERVGVDVEARTSWPTGMAQVGIGVRGRIADAERAEDGRVVARLSDLGWGGRLRALLAVGGPDVPVPDDLLDAVTAVLRDWGWSRRPVAVAAVPSRRHPVLVSSLARRLAAVGRLEHLGVLDLRGGGPSGGPGGNSATRLASVWGRFAVPDGTAERLTGLTGPVLLVDDLVDSRWTLTVAARELRLAGADAVLPFALAASG